MNIKEKIAKVQEEVGKMQKNQKGYNYQYFDINQLLDKLQPLCKKNKLLLTQPLTHIEGKPAIMTRVQDLESDDEVVEVTPLLEVAKPQDMGSCITYYRRYFLQSFFALEAEDDDGKQAQNSGSKPASRPASSDVPF